MQIGLKIKLVNHNFMQAMKENGFKSVAALSRACGISNKTLGDFLNLKGIACEESIKKLEKVLKCPKEYLFPDELCEEVKKKRQTNYYVSKEVKSLPDADEYKQIVYQNHDKLMGMDLDDDMDALMDTLTEREKEVLQYRFGIKTGKPMDLQGTGDVFNITRERVRQIEAKALRKLRHPTRSDKLRKYLK